MGSELSQTKVQSFTSDVTLHHAISPQLKLSNQRLLQIYQNVIAISRSSSSSPYDTTTSEDLLLTPHDERLNGIRHIDDALFQQCFALSEDVRDDLFKAFDKDDDGVVEWRMCLAGLTLCGEADVQQKCELILSMFDLNQKASIGAEELHNVISVSVLAACRICEASGSIPNEIHLNPGAIAQDVLDDIQRSEENKNGSIPVRSLSAYLQHCHSLQQALSDLGLLGNPSNFNATHMSVNPHTQSSPQHLRPTQSLSNTSTNGLHHTWVWANVFPSHPSMPCSRSRHAACHHDNQIYIHGGRNGTLALKDFWKYDTTSNIWTQMKCGGDTPPSLQEHTMVSHNGMLYLFGGEFGFRDADDIPLWIFNINKKSWRQLKIISDVKTPCSRRGHTAVIHQDALHVFGGYVDLKGAISEFWSLDFVSCWWHLNPDNPSNESPAARHLHSAVVYDDAMWVYGGLNNLVALKDLWKWDFGTRQWSKIKFWSGPPALHGHSAVTTHDAMLIFGGQNGDGVIKSDLWKYHFGSQSWQKIVSHKGLIPPPSTRHVFLSMSSTAQLESPIMEEFRPRSAPHPSRQRKVTPLLQVVQQLQDSEIRPHSSPPCVTQNDDSSRAHRKHFKNRIHPSVAATAADDDNIPDSLHSEEADSNVTDDTPLIPAPEEQNPSAIGSAMSPKRLFNRSKWTADHSNRVLYDRHNRPIKTETEVISNRFAPDVLIVEDISDVSSLSSFQDEEECQPCVEQCQPAAKQHDNLGAQCNIFPPASLSGSSDNLPLVFIEPLVVPHNQTVPNKSQSTIPLNQKLSSDRSQSAMTFSIYNNLDLPTGKYSNSVTPDKNLNYKTIPAFGDNNLSPTRQKTIVEQKAEVKSMHSQHENHCAEQNMFSKQESSLLDQNVHMQEQKCHQNKKIAINMHSKITDLEEQTVLERPVNLLVERRYQHKEPLKQTEPVKSQYSEFDRTNNVEPNHLQRNYNIYKEPKDSMVHNRQNGEVTTRPKLHGRSQTEQALPLDTQGGGAVIWKQQGGYRSAYDADKDQYAGCTSPCLILLGGQETLTSNLQYMTNPISMWKCHIVLGKPTKKEIQQLLSQ